MINIEELSKKDLFILVSSFLGLLLLLILPAHNPVSVAASDRNLFIAVNQTFNSYFYLSSLGQFLCGDFGVKVLLLIGIASTYLCLISYRNDSVILLSGVILSWALVVICFGYNFSSLALLSFVPIFVLCINSIKRFSVPSASLLVIVSISIWLCIFNLALFGFLLAVLICTIFNRDNLTFNKKSTITIFLTFFVLFLANALMPNLPWPDYPPGARLTQLFDAPAWFARPLIGPDFPIPVIDRLSVRMTLSSFVVPAAILVLVLVIIKPGRLLALLGSILILLYLDLNASESIAQISPIQSVSRILPGLYQTPISPIFLSLTLLSISLFIGINLKNGILLQTLLCIAAFLTIKAGPINQNIFSSTPSSVLGKFFDKKTLLISNLPYKAVSPRKKLLDIKSSNEKRNNMPGLVIDKDPASRWESGLGKQNGNEWIEFYFSTPVNARGIELNTGNFASDFPRAVVVWIGDNCNPQDLKQVAKFNKWQGYPLFSPAGLAYFSAQSDVKIFFDADREFSCLRVEQTGKTQNFDWSIAELRLLVPKDNTLEQADDGPEHN